MGPVTAQTAMVTQATVKAAGRPVTLAVHLAKRVKRDVVLIGLMYPPPV
jgi:hypothetical protein